MFSMLSFKVQVYLLVFLLSIKCASISDDSLASLHLTENKTAGRMALPTTTNVSPSTTDDLNLENDEFLEYASYESSTTSSYSSMDLLEAVSDSDSSNFFVYNTDHLPNDDYFFIDLDTLGDMNFVTEAPLPGHEFDDFFQPEPEPELELESEVELEPIFPSNKDDIVVGSEIYHRLVADFMV